MIALELLLLWQQLLFEVHASEPIIVCELMMTMNNYRPNLMGYLLSKCSDRKIDFRQIYFMLLCSKFLLNNSDAHIHTHTQIRFEKFQISIDHDRFDFFLIWKYFLIGIFCQYKSKYFYLAKSSPLLQLAEMVRLMTINSPLNWSCHCPCS